METNLKYCIVSERSDDSSDVIPFKRGLNWKTTRQEPLNMAAECQIAWSSSPYCYSTLNHTPCLSFRHRIVDSTCKNTALTYNNHSEKLKLSKEQHSDSTSTLSSKVLKFGIERILSDNGILESSSAVTSVNGTEINNNPKTETASKSRRKNGTRSVFSYLQRNLLERHYQRREYVTKGERYHIALQVGISEKQVKIWFQNRRTKKKKLEKSKSTAEKSLETMWFYS